MRADQLQVELNCILRDRVELDRGIAVPATSKFNVDLRKMSCSMVGFHMFS